MAQGTKTKIIIIWRKYFMAFFAGLLMANSVPHFLHGFASQEYPTPFANPPFEGLSSPLVNILWALLCLVLGLVLAWRGSLPKMDSLRLLLFLAGVAVIAASNLLFG